MKQLGMHRVDGRAYWFGAYFNPFDRERMVRHAGQARADRFHETFGGRLPFREARIVRVFDEDGETAKQFSETFSCEVARTSEEFAEGLDGVIVPFPAGGPKRDYRAIAPLVECGIPLFLDRIILEQSEVLRSLCVRAGERCAPLHVTSFIRYLAEVLLPEGVATARSVTASTGGEPSGYGADLLDLIDELTKGRAIGVTNVGNDEKDDLRIRYADGQEATLQLHRSSKAPMRVTASGDGWTRSLELDGSQNHLGAMRQFEVFLRSLDTREPPVSYERVRANAAILHAAERRQFGTEFDCSG